MKAKRKSFIFGLFDEYRNVIWPSKSRVMGFLWVVLVFVAVSGLFLGGIDFVLTLFFNWVFGLR